MRVLSPADKNREIIEKQQMRESRSAQAFRRKNIMDMVKKEVKYFQTEKHNLVKGLKEEAQEENQRKMFELLKKRSWMKTLAISRLICSLNKLFQHNKKIFLRKEEISFFIVARITNYRKKIQRKGDTTYHRLLFDIRG